MLVKKLNDLTVYAQPDPRLLMIYRNKYKYRMKTAVLVSGEFRCHHKVHGSWQKYLGDCDYYWALYHRDRKNSMKFINALPTKGLLSYKQEIGPNANAMFHGMSKVWEIVDLNYDCIIRLRPDIMLGEDIRAWFDPNFLTVDTEHPSQWSPNRGIQDQIALGPPHLMEMFFNCQNLAGDPHARLMSCLKNAPRKNAPMYYILARSNFKGKDYESMARFMMTKNKVANPKKIRLIKCHKYRQTMHVLQDEIKFL